MKEKIESSALKIHTIRCLLNEEFKAYKGSKEIVIDYWEKANTLDEFKNLVLSDSRLKNNQGYAELSKESEGHWYRVREMFGEKCFKTESDGGSVKVGNENFTISIGNGHGDGTTRIAIFTKDDFFNEDMMNFSGIKLEGNFNIYDYDFGNDVVMILKGTYYVYYYDGLVAFEEV